MAIQTTATLEDQLSFCSEQAPSLKYNPSNMSLGAGHALEAMVIGIDNLSKANQFVDYFEVYNCVYIGNSPMKHVSRISFELKSGVVMINLIQNGKVRRIWFDPTMQDCLISKSENYGRYGQTYKITIELKETELKPLKIDIENLAPENQNQWLAT